ncbi:MAG: sulfatase [Planctomycetes bacterium]|nr:sulfatase [Planctomycetota bacterium]
MKRRLAALVLASLVVLCGCGRERPARLVLLSIDTLRADHLGCYGYARDTTPRLDALAQQAVLFESVQSTASSTAPSHMTIMTGVLPAVHGIRNEADHGLAPGIATLAERLHERGFATAAFAGGGYVNEALGFARGFDVFDSRLEPFETKLARIAEWLDDVDDERPAFLFVHTYAVHAPYLPAPEHDLWSDPDYAGPLRERVPLLRARFLEGLGDDLGAQAEVFWEGSHDFDAADVAHLVDLYDGAIHQTDAGVGVLLDALGSHGWLDAGPFVLTSDHGEAFGEHGTFNHRQLHQEELSVPLIVRPPGGRPTPLRVRDPVSSLDLAPTLLELLGLPVPPEMQGRSLLPFEGGHPARPRLSSGGEELRMDAVLLDGRKLVTRRRIPRQLYDLRDDPGEASNLIDLSSTLDWPARLDALIEAMHADADTLRGELGEPGAAGALSDEQRRQLEALGYVQR